MGVQGVTRSVRHTAVLPCAAVEIRFIGSGDAFGHGGRLQACISLRSNGFHALLDFGQTSLLGLRREGIDPRDIDAVLVSHFHGDHDGGLPFLILDGQFTKRTRPLVIAGPPGIRERMREQMEAAIPTLSRTVQRYPIEYLGLGVTPCVVGPLRVTATPAVHTPRSEPLAMRVEAGGAAVAYTGDSEWTPALAQVARGADLLIAEAYSVDKAIPYHLSYRALMSHRAELDARRIVLTHLGPETLARIDELELDHADDGTTIEL